MRRRYALTLVVLVTFLGACTPHLQEEPPPVMPEVNDANCRPEVVAALPKSIQQAFGSACFHRGTYTPSPPRQW
ncbi:entry exclusion lipoprotein TrbK [Azohydromonas lata]|uniref:entry exclusion lipoprotein TrbK n=1 Tax=Azohydromonas lata TaxID=45677 RepID=UPI000A01395D